LFAHTIYRLGLEFKIGHSIRYKILILDIFELLKLLISTKGQNHNRAAQKTNLLTTLAELWSYDSRNLCSENKFIFWATLWPSISHGGFSFSHFKDPLSLSGHPETSMGQHIHLEDYAKLNFIGHWKFSFIWGTQLMVWSPRINPGMKLDI